MRHYRMLFLFLWGVFVQCLAEIVGIDSFKVLMLNAAFLIALNVTVDILFHFERKKAAQ